jgi:hypothetical protein
MTSDLERGIKAAAETPGMKAVDGCLAVAFAHGCGLPVEHTVPGNTPMEQAARALIAALDSPSDAVIEAVRGAIEAAMGQQGENYRRQDASVASAAIRAYHAALQEGK